MEGSLENRLYEAAAEGNTKSLQELLEQDKFVVDRVSFTSPNKTTPLHVATTKGHLAFVQQILNRNPQIAEELDSQQSSPLHIASAKGYLEIVNKLLSAAAHMCMSRDCQGRNPLHLAAMRGHVEILKALIQEAPRAAREKADRDQTVLHLCVKHGQLEALKILAPNLNDRIDTKDDDGDTILHMAVADKQTEIIQYLVESTKIDVYARNSHGQTPMDIVVQSQPEERNLQIKSILRLKYHNISYKTETHKMEWLTQRGADAIMVMAVLIATVAYQAGVSPAGGIWQETLTQDSNANPHRAGEAVMAYTHPQEYKNFLRSNTIAFFSSVTAILLMISGGPFTRKLYFWILIIIMWLTVISLSVSYAISIYVVTPTTVEKSMPRDLKIGVGVWFGSIGILFVGSRVKRLDKWLKEKGITNWWTRRSREVKNCSQEIV
ncbi:hypothetical protein BUALT_Bualt10G0129300 [Buddleja alternifolia]|uniref:PGG domain-containing protein n=1 Tax=Buddleja alternifolia TaxID=168488 RepID=A0AAV6X921_9LAMI|nr:hypothetical protein BUALT_Bualt10G0129300 [Buddleja alternifolia]